MSVLNVIVVGGGFAGMSAAARIAKLGHRVSIVEKEPQLGGRLRPISIDSEQFHLHSPSLTLPGVVRDLFRKSGRTIDKEIQLHPITGRRHYFPGHEPFTLALGTRGDHLHSLTDAGFAADEFTHWLDSQADLWDICLRIGLQKPLRSINDLSREQLARLKPRSTLGRTLPAQITDPLVRQIVADRFRADNLDPNRVPTFLSVIDYVERNFGLWRFAGGHQAFAEALTKRLAERKVELHTSTLAHSFSTGFVETERGRMGADVIIWCAPLPENVSTKARARKARARTFVVLNSSEPFPEEAMAHGPAVIRMSRENNRLTLEHEDHIDPIDYLATLGLDMRDMIDKRYTLSATEVSQYGHFGYEYSGWKTILERPGIKPIPGVFFAGAHAHPGTSIEMIGMATTTIAESLRPHAPMRNLA